MAAWLDNVRYTPTAGSTTDWTFSAALLGYQSPALGGVVNGRNYKYFAISADSTQWEMGEGSYNTGTGVLTRTTVLSNSSGTGTATGQSGAGTKINFSTVPTVAIVGIKEDLISIEEANSFTAAQKVQAQTNIGVREVLTAARTYFVLTTGSDSNTGLVNTAGGAFLTIQKAINTVYGLDINTQNVTIQVGAGTYAGAAVFNGQWMGSGTVTLTGDTTTPSNVVISSAATCIAITNCQVIIQGFKLVSSGGFLLTCGSNAIGKLGGAMEWGAYSFGGISISGNAVLQNAATACTISGAGTGVFLALGVGGKFDNLVVSTWTVAAGAALTVTTFAFADSQSYLNANGMTFSLGAGASVTGTRFQVKNGAYINTGGGGANFFPGTVAGSGTNFSASPWGLYA